MDSPVIETPTGVVLDSEVQVKWTSVEGANCYSVVLQNHDKKKYSSMGFVNKTECSLKGLEPAIYKIWVRAYRFGPGVFQLIGNGSKVSLLRRMLKKLISLSLNIECSLCTQRKFKGRFWQLFRNLFSLLPFKLSMECSHSNYKTIRLMPRSEYRALIGNVGKFAVMVPSGKLPQPPNLVEPRNGEIVPKSFVMKWKHHPKGKCTYDVILLNSETAQRAKDWLDLNECQCEIEVDRPGVYGFFVAAQYKNHPDIGTKTLWSQRIDVEVVSDYEKKIHEEEKKFTWLCSVSNRSHAEFMDNARKMTYQDNRALKRDEIENGVIEMKSFPLLMGVQLGTLCNIDCVFCDNGRITSKNKSLPERYLNELKLYLPFLETLSIDGGEPLLFKQFKEIAALANDCPNVSIITNTNGQLLDDEWINYFTNGRFRQIAISVDAGTPLTYRSLRRGGELIKIVDATKVMTLKRRDLESPCISWIFIVNAFNYREIMDFMNLAIECGVDRVIFKTIIVFPGPYFDNVELMDFLQQKDVCESVLKDLWEAERLCLEHGILFFERVYTNILRRWPDLAFSWRHLPHVDPFHRENIKSQLEISGLPDLSSKISAYHCKLRSKNETLNKGTLAGLDDDQVERPVPLNIDPSLCSSPFTYLNMSGANYGRACCFGKNNVRPIFFKNHWFHIHDVWSSPQMQLLRKHMYAKEYEKVCMTNCPMIPKLIKTRDGL